MRRLAAAAFVFVFGLFVRAAAPSVTGLPGTLTFTEDTTGYLNIAASAFADLDNDTITVTLAASSGRFLYAGDGNVPPVALSGIVSPTMTVTGLPFMVNAYFNVASNIIYQPGENVAGASAATITVSANDGSGPVQLGIITVNITPVNDAPSITTGGTLPAVDEDTASPPGTALNALGITVTDPDAGATVSGFAIVANTANSVTQGTWQYSTNAGGNWFAIGTVADGATALVLSPTTRVRFVPVINFNGAPAGLTFRALDNTYGGGFSTTTGAETRINVNTTTNGGSTAISADTGTIATSITAVNDGPVLSPANAVSGYTENGAATILSPALTITDPDTTNFASATVRINDGVAGDVLSAGATAPFTASFNAGNYTLTLTGPGTLAQLQAALRTVAYSSSSEDPSFGGTDGTRSFSFQVTEEGTGVLSNSVTAQVAITARNDAPSITAGGTLAAVDEDTANPPGAALNALGITVTDPDGGASVSGFAIVGNTANSVTQGTWQYSTNAGGNWFAIGTVADGAAALLLSTTTLVRFVPVANFSGAPAGLTFRAIDNTYGGGFSTTAGAETRVNVDSTTNGGTTAISANTGTIATSITGMNDIPVVTTSGGTTAYTEGNNTTATIAIDGALVVSDIDSTTFASATVSITSGHQAAQDVLAFTNDGSTMGNIAVDAWNAATGVLTLTSAGASATLAHWQAALRAVTYSNTSDTPNTTNRVITFVVNDGTASSAGSTKTVSITAVNDSPVVTTSGGTTASPKATTSSPRASSSTAA